MKRDNLQAWLIARDFAMDGAGVCRQGAIQLIVMRSNSDSISVMASGPSGEKIITPISESDLAAQLESLGWVPSSLQL